jgi:hypothetical protein
MFNQPASGGSSGSGASTVADGADVALGAVADAIVEAGAPGTVSAKLRRVTQGLEDLKSLIVLAAGEGHIGAVGGNGDIISKEFTRPADTTAYAAKDVVSNSTSAPALIQFDNVARIASGSGYITSASIETDKKDCTARFKLWLYQDNTPTPINDNSPFLELYANNSVRLGTIEFDAMTTEDATNSTGARTQKTNINLFFKADANKRIWGMLETLDVFTPASGQKFNIKLRSDQN